MFPEVELVFRWGRVSGDCGAFERKPRNPEGILEFGYSDSLRSG